LGAIVPLTRNVGNIFLDLDGVLADFDTLAGRMLKTDNIYKYEFVHGADAFWAGINQDPNFFANLPLKADALELWFAVKPYKPIILTALPHTGAERVDHQKRQWCRTYLGEVSVITCQTKEKPDYCKPGDVLVDDRAINRERWEARGGRFLLHQNATATNVALNHYGYI
jgi:hypothetical protein